MQVVKYMFQPHGDSRGQLVAFEEFKDIPFRIKRVYYMYDTLEGVVRGKHAHKNLEQILVCIHGSCKILLDNGYEKKLCRLKSLMKDCTLPMTCGAKCTIFLLVQCFWFLLPNFMMKMIIFVTTMNF